MGPKETNQYIEDLQCAVVTAMQNKEPSGCQSCLMISSQCSLPTSGVPCLWGKIKQPTNAQLANVVTKGL